MDQPKTPTPDSKPPRKAYRPPVLTLFGDVRHLTSGGGGTMNDGGGMNTRMCWIAEALYGIGSPRVFLVRGWLKKCQERGDGWALMVVPLYERFGERVAAAIRAFPPLGGCFRPFFDAAVASASRAYCDEAASQRRFDSRVS